MAGALRETISVVVQPILLKIYSAIKDPMTVIAAAKPNAT